MKDLMGIINLSESEEAIKELTYNRPIATIPIAGRNRVIDFTLSNMVNAGIHNVAIFTQGKSRSLMDHIETGKDWDLDRKIDGLFVLNPVINLHNLTFHNGDIENFKNHMDYLEHSKQSYVLLARSYMICNANYAEVFKYHKETGADITIMYKKMENNYHKFLNCDTLNLDERDKVLNIGRNTGTTKFYNMSMETYIMKKGLLLEIIKNSIATGSSQYLKQAILQSISKLNVNAYPFNGYLSCVNSIQNYYRTNMELLDIEVSQELFHKNGLIYTKVKNEPPTEYTDSARITNSLVANGCIIEGVVENSIIGRGVKIERGAVVKDSIIMRKSTIEECVYLKDVILDKYVYITKGKVLSGDKSNPFVVKKNMRL
ncbi:glucose-1-phosphate adenylyltransferase subunit GlgD [Wukongibacter sp. M2B1]|uniref:glucose-1-phosphate adenylyltransferase subunit GlgD n=1 Tax=Wukongibacter sp. M2B1 TaxID=3088895 RepID=UPI003D7B45F1